MAALVANDVVASDDDHDVAGDDDDDRAVEPLFCRPLLTWIAGARFDDAKPAAADSLFPSLVPPGSRLGLAASHVGLLKKVVAREG